MYLGWDYHGFAVQEDTDQTIETALFEALTRTKLIESRFADIMCFAFHKLNLFNLTLP